MLGNYKRKPNLVIRVNIKELVVIRDGRHSTLLKDVKFELDKTNIYSIVGKNGTGKSTLIKALTGLLDQRFYSIYGHVDFETENLLNLDDEKLRAIRKNKIKYVFQDARNSFDPLKKFRYYFNNLSVAQSTIDELLQYFLLPKSKELFNLHAYEVSGGMAQRVSLALALLAKPLLIIMDEPTSGIDSAIANLFLLKLKEYVKNTGSAILLVTHDLTYASKISNKIALLSQGKLTEFLPPKEFYAAQENNSSDNLISSFLQLGK